MTHSLAPVLLAIPTLALAIYFGVTGVRATLNAPDDDEII